MRDRPKTETVKKHVWITKIFYLIGQESKLYLLDQGKYQTLLLSFIA